VRRLPLQIIAALPPTVFILLCVLAFVLFRFDHKNKVRFTLIFIVLVLAVFALSYKSVHVSQSEIEALKFLYKQPQGRVLVFNRDCLRCTWQTGNQPAAMAGYKKYIGKASGKEIVERPDDIKSERARTRADYVYLTKYEEYIEQIPFPPDTIGLTKLYENANVQILGVVK
jgi:hypothetical protein